MGFYSKNNRMNGKISRETRGLESKTSLLLKLRLDSRLQGRNVELLVNGIHCATREHHSIVTKFGKHGII